MSEFSRETELLYSEIKALHAQLKELGASRRLMIKPRLKKLNKKIQDLDSHLNTEKDTFTPAEFNRNKAIIQQLERSSDQLESLLSSSPVKESYELTSKAEYDTKSNAELHQMQQRMLKQQDEDIDKLLGTTQRLKQQSLNIQDELESQAVILDDLDKGVELNTRKLGKVQSRMVNFLDKSSNCCLIFIVILLTVLMVLLIIY